MNFNKRKPATLPSSKNITAAAKENELKAMVEQVLTNNGEIRRMRVALQSKILDIVRGGDKTTIIKYPNGGDAEPNETIALINQLILEYFEWNGYQYSRELFALETNAKFISNQDRHKLEQRFGMDTGSGIRSLQQQPHQPEASIKLPILLHIIAMNMLKR